MGCALVRTKEPTQQLWLDRSSHTMLPLVLVVLIGDTTDL
jgi:hypothetical protein